MKEPKIPISEKIFFTRADHCSKTLKFGEKPSKTTMRAPRSLVYYSPTTIVVVRIEALRVSNSSMYSPGESACRSNIVDSR